MKLNISPQTEVHSPEGVLHSLFHQKMMRGLPFVRSWSLSSLKTFDRGLLIQDAKVLLNVAGIDNIDSTLYEAPLGWLLMAGNPIRGGYYLQIACKSQRVLDEWGALIDKMMPKPVVLKRDSVPVTFWVSGTIQPSGFPRNLTVPDWSVVAGNYPSSTRNQLSAMMSDFKTDGGKLILWHGEPGTGKTWALRALLSEWRSWCSAHYIVDPEKLFGSNSQYLLQVLLQPDDHHGGFGPSEEDGAAPVGRRKTRNWKLLILEDTGELISEDARTRAGQGLSRLLNVTDGLIGQGLKVIVMVTTNEAIHDLHPAVSRPGRTAAKVEFERFNAIESEAWLNQHGHQAQLESQSVNSLAELYARIGASKETPLHRIPVGS